MVVFEINVILIDPRIPGNVGAIARIIKNFDNEKLLIVNSENLELITDESRARAKHGAEILKNSIIFDSLQHLLAQNKFDFLIGTTAQPGGSYNPLRITISPREMCHNLDIDANIGILFGREDSGLTNEELNLCDFIVTIPAGTYTTLNISHAVGIMLYEIFYWKNSVGKNVIYRKANIQHKNNLLIKFESILNFLHSKISKFNEHHVQDTNRIFKNLIGRAFISEREANTLGRVLRYVDESLQGIWKERL